MTPSLLAPPPGPAAQPPAPVNGNGATAAMPAQPAPAHIAPPAAPPAPTPFRRAPASAPAPAAEGERTSEPAAASDMDDDEVENQKSLPAIQPDMKPKAVDTCDKM